MQSNDESAADTDAENARENLPSNHFTETDLQKEWSAFLTMIQQEDFVIYNAIKGFRVEKLDENLIRICYPSETAKAEFDKVSIRFINTLKHKVNNFHIEISYHLDAKNMKREVETKRSRFEKMAERNPLLWELDKIFKFDFNS